MAGLRAFPIVVGFMLLGSCFLMVAEYLAGYARSHYSQIFPWFFGGGVALGAIGVYLKRDDGATPLRFVAGSAVFGVCLFATSMVLRCAYS